MLSVAISCCVGHLKLLLEDSRKFLSCFISELHMQCLWCDVIRCESTNLLTFSVLFLLLISSFSHYFNDLSPFWQAQNGRGCRRRVYQSDAINDKNTFDNDSVSNWITCFHAWWPCRHHKGVPEVTHNESHLESEPAIPCWPKVHIYHPPIRDSVSEISVTEWASLA